MAMIIIIYIAIFYIIVALVIGLYQKSTNAICLSKKRLDGKTVIVTGGTLGMGYEIAKDLADRGARTIIACPFVDEGETAKKNIIQDTENERVVFKLLDLSSIASIRQFVKDIYATEERLDLLMNNAGIGTVEEFITKDGMSVIMQVNYFGQFLLTILLLPLLKKSGTNSDPARIVNTSSSFHWFGFINFARLNDIKFWYPLFFYANSKLCLLSFSYELTKKLREPNVVVNSVDPGFVGTGIFYSVGRFFGGIIRLALFVLSKTPWEGAQTALHVALDKKAGAVSGKYFRNCNLSVARKVSCDDKTAKQLWEESVRLVGLSDEELNQCLIY
ncbi:retinol dehydrogenase 11-like [Bicyclus anynana]|uniref:Retinol dehydrogenase 11-like n=1 Tax=Bicyclus anynana TaxID=110368 RepID=A0A6J1N4N7_BICAN|nr:retinol dehydrogenase 11-like [Bicyclus anynana]